MREKNKIELKRTYDFEQMSFNKLIKNKKYKQIEKKTTKESVKQTR